MEKKLTITIEDQEKKDYNIKGSELKFVDFPKGRNFRWTWFADISESGKGWLGQLGDSRPVGIARGEKVKFTAQFIPTTDFNRMSWRDFHDFCHDTKRNVLEISLSYDFSSGRFRHSLFVSVELLTQLFEIYDKNDLSYTRNVQPRILDVQK